MQAAALTTSNVTLPGGARLSLRRGAGDASRRRFLLVHGLASNARMWDGVSKALVAAGREVVAIDLRGHGLSEDTRDGHSTQAAAADLAALCGVLDWSGECAPIVVGQSWGGNVVVTLAAEHGGVAAIGCIDGGWLRLGAQFDTFDECWRALAPPHYDGLSWPDVRRSIAAAHRDWPIEAVEGALANLVELPGGGVRNRLARDHHRDILHSMWAADPREFYPRVGAPVLLMPAAAPTSARVAAAISEALRLLPKGRVSWYDGAHHDLHAQHPQRVAEDLLALDAWAAGERA